MLSFDCETGGLDPRHHNLICVSSYDGSNSGLEFSNFGSLFDENTPKIGHNIKFDLTFLKYNGVEIRGEIHDTKLMAYLIDPERKSTSLKDLAEELLGVSVIRFEDVCGKGKKQITFDKAMEQNPELATKYAKQDAELTYKLFHVLKEQMSSTLWQLYTKLEIPLIRVLMDMEMSGIEIDTDYLDYLEKSTRSEIWRALKNLRQYPHLNYNSPKQVGELLYNKLKLPKIKVTAKKQPSTDTEVLKQLEEKHPFPKYLLQYRDAKKRLSTYIEPIKEEAQQNEGKLYPHFNQMVTATGRLSSSSPINLQNIPNRTASGRAIRRVFISKAVYVFVEADYAQIEPRIMAHCSRDPNLIKLFGTGSDLYTGVVAQVLQLPEKEAEEKRALGKLLFLAMGYGAQPNKLVKAAKQNDVDITEEEAGEFILRAEQTYSVLFQYKRSIINQARQLGYVTTLCGRVRHIRGLKDPNKWVRMEAERQAFNTVIQGSAADIMKMALLKLNRAGYDLKLTVHDSVLIELLDDEEALADIVAEAKLIMENIVKLRVPLKVDIKVGNNWGFEDLGFIGKNPLETRSLK